MHGDAIKIKLSGRYIEGVCSSELALRRVPLQYYYYVFVYMIYVGCRFAIAPGVEASGLRIGVSFFRQNDTKLPQLTTVLTIRSNDSAIVDATIVTVSNTCQPVNSSVCHIAGLEVYRGRRQVTEISHEGFFLSESGIIKVSELSIRVLINLSLYLYIAINRSLFHR